MNKAYFLLLHLIFLHNNIAFGDFFRSMSENNVIQKSENTYELRDGDYYANLEISSDYHSYIFIVYRWPNKQDDIVGANIEIINEQNIRDDKELYRIEKVKKLLLQYWLEHDENIELNGNTELNKKDIQRFLSKIPPPHKTR